MTRTHRIGGAASRPFEQLRGLAGTCPLELDDAMRQPPVGFDEVATNQLDPAIEIAALADDAADHFAHAAIFDG